MHGDRTLKKVVLGDEFYTRHAFNIRKLTYDYFYENGRHKPYVEIWEADLPLTVNTWLRIRTAIAQAENRLKKNTELDDKIESIGNFLGRIDRGSK